MRRITSLRPWKHIARRIAETHDVTLVALEIGATRTGLYKMVLRDHAAWWRDLRDRWKRDNHAKHARQWRDRTEAQRLAVECAASPDRH